LHIFCSFRVSNNPNTQTSFDDLDNNGTTSPRMHNSETEDVQAKTNEDMKLTVNFDRIEVTLSRKETCIVGAVIEGEYI
jgi:hypothetical protein